MFMISIMRLLASRPCSSVLTFKFCYIFLMLNGLTCMSFSDFMGSFHCPVFLIMPLSFSRAFLLLFCCSVQVNFMPMDK